MNGDRLKTVFSAAGEMAMIAGTMAGKEKIPGTAGESCSMPGDGWPECRMEKYDHNQGGH